ncbi:MAG: response regulator [Ruminococcus sp.]|jgi:signal transduction histidine kinase/CheY-like chemotaxis protein|nr:response regulator [Ruminococcus sp.]
MKSKEYSIANWVGRFGVILYGLLRLFETLILKENIPNGVATLIMCFSCVIIITTVQELLKTSPFVPIVTGIVIMGSFIFGGYYVRDFDYYFISMLCTVGIVCMYQNFHILIDFLLINILVNIPMFFIFFNNPEIANFRTMIISGVLYLYGFFFLIILTYRASIRETSANTAQSSFNSILNSTPNMMFIIDDMRKITYISNKMAEFADCPTNYAINRPVLDLFDDFEIKLMFADIINSEKYFENIFELKKDNKIYYFKVMCTPLEGDIKGMFVDVSDITATIMAKNEAEEEKENAIRANLSKSRFLATMSHEIRTPMNAIIGISQMQMARQDLPEDVIEANKKIYDSGHGLLGIINDILDMSKIETGKLELVPIKYDLPSLINDSVQLNIPRIGSKQIEFNLDVSELVPSELYGDELKIKQVLNNILSNAIKYTDSGSILMKVYHTQINKQKVTLTFSITDTGQGMSEDDVKALGNEFSRFNLNANRLTEGTGLGMNITRRLVDLMDGDIEIQSEYGVGSTFTVTLPQLVASNETVGADLVEKLKNFTFSREKQTERLQIVREYMPYGRVLVVDDVETNLYVAVGLLKPYGIKVETVSSGFATLERINNGKVYDIIFMDHMMPRMDGIETTERLRKMGYTAPIVALTANAIVGNDDMFKAKGFDDFISKPIDIRQLNSVLNQYVRDKSKSDASEKPPASFYEPQDENILSPELIEVFTRDAEKIIRIIREIGCNDLKLFTTMVHSMKSACANIGNLELSEFAKKLENAGRETDIVYIKANTNDFIDKLEKFCEGLSGKEEKLSEIETDGDALLEITLKEIADACEEYDEEKISALITELEKYKWDDEIKKAISDIKLHILHSEFEEAADLARLHSLPYIDLD